MWQIKFSLDKQETVYIDTIKNQSYRQSVSPAAAPVEKEMEEPVQADQKEMMSTVKITWVRHEE